VVRRGPGLLLGVAAVAVAFAAADTYVVVLALPDMMAGVELSIGELQRAAPIVSGFLLGYVAMLPLMGRIADLRGRLPVLVGSLLVFALGSLVTAAAYDLPSMVAGRFVQGVGAGGLVPATLALVADIYPPARRGVPLGVVGAVQELGSVLGPLYGAVVLAAADWHAIFALNLVVGVALAVLLAALPRERPAERSGPPDLLGVALAAMVLAGLVLTMLQPPSLASRVTLGLAFVPFAGASRWFTPVGMATGVLAVLFLVRCRQARRPLVDVRGWARLSRSADLVGAGLLGLSLAGVILAFATADPQVSAFAPSGPWLLAGSVVAAVAFGWHSRRAAHPLVPRGAFVQRPAWGALAVSFFVGAALIAALVDIPIFARVTLYPDSQLDAALVLMRLLVALPVGALAGGYLTRKVTSGAVTAVGMGLATVGFVGMAQWGPTSLADPLVTLPLVAAGLGFGLALAPVNAALLASTAAAVHGVTSALLVVARMVGMLVGVSALTTLGLRRYYAVQADLPAPADVCAARTQCPAYTALLKEAGLAQLQTVFIGAAVCAALAAVLALVLFRSAQTRAVPTSAMLGAAG
jgi:MFS family permease